MKAASLTVGDVAKRSGVAVSAVHFYEAKGLIHSWRDAANQRRFSRDVLRRIAVIKAAQVVGIPLAAIGETLGTLPNDRAPNASDWARLSTHWQEQLKRRISILIALSDQLDVCIGCGCLSLDSCPLYNPDDISSADGPGANFLG